MFEFMSIVTFQRRFIDNIGAVLDSEELGKLKFQMAGGWPMTICCNVPPQAAVIQHN
jgi:hypothetical protein